MSFSSKFKAQVVRAVRLFIVTLAAQPAIIAVSGGSANVGKAAVVAAVVAAVEVTVRAVWPTTSLGAIEGVVGSFAKRLVAKTPPPAA